MPPKPTGSGKGSDRDVPQKLMKQQPSTQNAAAAVGILKALDPHPDTPQLRVEHSDEQLSGREEKKKGFWERASERNKEREKEKERHKERERKEEEVQAELTRMIGTSPVFALPLRIFKHAQVT